MLVAQGLQETSYFCGENLAATMGHASCLRKLLLELQQLDESLPTEATIFVNTLKPRALMQPSVLKNVPWNKLPKKRVMSLPENCNQKCNISKNTKSESKNWNAVCLKRHRCNNPYVLEDFRNSVRLFVPMTRRRRQQHNSFKGIHVQVQLGFCCWRPRCKAT